MRPRGADDPPAPGSPQEGKRLCWKCGTWYGPEAAVCVRCGVNLETGEEIRPGADKPEQELTSAQRLLMFIADWTPGLLRLRVIVLSVALALLGFCVMGLGLVFLGLGVVFTAVAIGAAGLIIYAQSVAWMLVGRIELLQDGLLDLESKKWPLFLALVFAPLLVGFLLLKLAVAS